MTASYSNWMLPPKSKYKIFQTELLHEPIIQRFQLTIKEASTVLCSVIKHAGSGRARKKCRGKHKTQWRVFHLFLSALQQNRAQSRLLYLFYDKESNNFPTHALNFETKLYFQRSKSGVSRVLISDKAR